MEPDSMELKVISCKDLKAFNFFQKLNIYVVVSIVNADDSTPSPTNNNNNEKKKQQQQKQKTPIDREGDGNPEWNHVMRFDLKDIISSSSSCSCLLLEFDLLSEGTILGDKTIGRVRVPLEDLIKEFNGGSVRFVSYQVRTPDGIPNGVLDFSFKPIFIHNTPNLNGDDDIPLIYRPMPSTYCYPPPLPVVDDDDDGSYINPSPATESYYPKIDQFHNQEVIHYPTLELIHSSPPSEFHNPSQPPEVYYPNPQPYPHPPPQLAYYPPPAPPLFYPPPPPADPYGVEFGRVYPNPAAYVYPNHWASTPPIHW